MKASYLLQLFESRELPAFYKTGNLQEAVKQPEFEQLEFLLETCHQRVKKVCVPKHVTYSSENIDNLLIDLFSGSFTKKQARDFLSLNYHSAVFTEKILRNLRITAFPINDTEIDADTVPSTNEIMSDFISELNKNQKKPPIKDRHILTPRLAKFFGTIAIIVLALFIVHINSPVYKMQKKYLNNPVKLSLDNSQLRGNLRASSAFAARWDSAFLWGVTHYKNKEYIQALEQFDELLDMKSETIDHQPQKAKSVYLYRGLCYLALSKGKKASPQLDKAVLSLEKVVHFDSPENPADEYLFFCGLGHFLKGNQSEAVTYLGKIPLQSQYFADAKYMIEKM